MSKVADGVIMTGVVMFIFSIGVVVGVAGDRYSDWHRKMVSAAEAHYAEKAFYDQQFLALQREVEK
jgi:hypothetical protein